MSKKYNTTWVEKKLVVNFNQKQWRQDLAAFVREKKFWGKTIVTKSKSLQNNPFNKGSKYFEIYDSLGNKFGIQYKGINEVEKASDINLLNEYMHFRG